MFIESIEDLLRAVKINKNTPFETLEPFVHNAIYNLIAPYLGSSLLEAIDESQNDYNATREQKTTFSLLLRAAGTLTLMLFTHEGSLSIGDSGHTVQRSSTFAPASDAKIAQAVRSFYKRGYLYLDEAIAVLIANQEQFTELKRSPLFLARQSNYIADVDTFERESGFPIHRSDLFLHHIRPFMTATERSTLINVIGVDLDRTFRSQPELHSQAVQLVQRYVSVRALVLFIEAPISPDMSLYYAPDCSHLLHRKTVLAEMADNYLSALKGHISQKYNIACAADLNSKDSSFFYAL